ncbi:CFA47 protein, partial [Origma solitaria]|nr:CFA47 protein [Origma solitaria]
LKSNPSEYQIILSGTMKSPKMRFHPPFLMLMPVPLDVETRGVFTIIPQDYIRKSQFRVKLPELELGDGTKTNPLTAEFPEGEDIDLLSDGTIVERVCLVTFRSSKPVSCLAEMLFIDEEEN